MAEWPCCHDPLRFSPVSLRFVPPPQTTSPFRDAPREVADDKHLTKLGARRAHHMGCTPLLPWCPTLVARSLCCAAWLGWPGWRGAGGMVQVLCGMPMAWLAWLEWCGWHGPGRVCMLGVRLAFTCWPRALGMACACWPRALGRACACWPRALAGPVRAGWARWQGLVRAGCAHGAWPWLACRACWWSYAWARWWPCAWAYGGPMACTLCVLVALCMGLLVALRMACALCMVLAMCVVCCCWSSAWAACCACGWPVQQPCGASWACHGQDRGMLVGCCRVVKPCQWSCHGFNHESFVACQGKVAGF